jgi:hypothetical protein
LPHRSLLVSINDAADILRRGREDHPFVAKADSAQGRAPRGMLAYSWSSAGSGV